MGEKCKEEERLKLDLDHCCGALVALGHLMAFGHYFALIIPALFGAFIAYQTSPFLRIKDGET
jgi:hypothetical protein